VHRASTTGGSVLFAHNLADRPDVRVPDIGRTPGNWSICSTTRSTARPTSTDSNWPVTASA